MPTKIGVVCHYAAKLEIALAAAKAEWTKAVTSNTSSRVSSQHKASQPCAATSALVAGFNPADSRTWTSDAVTAFLQQLLIGTPPKESPAWAFKQSLRQNCQGLGKRLGDLMQSAQAHTEHEEVLAANTQMMRAYSGAFDRVVAKTRENPGKLSPRDNQSWMTYLASLGPQLKVAEAHCKESDRLRGQQSELEQARSVLIKLLAEQPQMASDLLTCATLYLSLPKDQSSPELLSLPLSNDQPEIYPKQAMPTRHLFASILDPVIFNLATADGNGVKLDNLKLGVALFEFFTATEQDIQQNGQKVELSQLSYPELRQALAAQWRERGIPVPSSHGKTRPAPRRPAPPPPPSTTPTLASAAVEADPASQGQRKKRPAPPPPDLKL